MSAKRLLAGWSDVPDIRLSAIIFDMADNYDCNYVSLVRKSELFYYIFLFSLCRHK